MPDQNVTTRSSFKLQLSRQVQWLSKSSAEYDRGDVDEAIRLSVPLRVLFHDTRGSTSLMTHLQVKEFRLLSTATTVSPTAGFWSATTNMRLQPTENLA